MGFLDRLLAPVGDYINDHLPEEDKWQPGYAWSYDWCRYRRMSRCWYSTELNVEATKEAGYSVWVPVDNGLCPRNKWDEQKACPVPSEPGPHSGEHPSYLDATVPWELGGQHGGHPVADYQTTQEMKKKYHL